MRSSVLRRRRAARADARALAAVAEKARLMLIDIPIGLRDEGREERRCDTEARRLLGAARRSSVFPVPVRPALYAEPLPRRKPGSSYRPTAKNTGYISNSYMRVADAPDLLPMS